MNKLGILKRLLIATGLTLILSSCGYNTMQSGDESVKAAWSEVVNQYQRRADLIPNLVKVVERYAGHEKEVLVGVADARASVGRITVTPDTLNNLDAFKKFQESQGALSQALSRLMMVSEQYPQLKADQQFRDLQAQLEGTENRIAVARNRYIKAVQDFNIVVRSFPANLTAMLFSIQVKPQFAVENLNEISKVPAVQFQGGK